MPITKLFEDKESGPAVADFLSRSLPVRRKMKVTCIAKAIDETSKEQIVKSWYTTGIMREMYGLSRDGAKVMYDGYVSQAEHEATMETQELLEDCPAMEDSDVEMEGDESTAATEEGSTSTLSQAPPAKKTRAEIV